MMDCDWACKPNKPFPPQFSFGHSLIAAIESKAEQHKIRCGDVGLEAVLWGGRWRREGQDCKVILSH